MRCFRVLAAQYSMLKRRMFLFLERQADVATAPYALPCKQTAAVTVEMKQKSEIARLGCTRLKMSLPATLGAVMAWRKRRVTVETKVGATLEATGLATLGVARESTVEPKRQWEGRLRSRGRWCCQKWRRGRWRCGL